MVAMLRSRCVLRDVGAAVVAAERHAAAHRRLVERLRLLASRAPPARDPGGTLSSNRVAGDDNPLLLVRIAVKPLAQPPFPLDRLAQI